MSSVAEVPTVNVIPLTDLDGLLDRFIKWFDEYGETSWDNYSYFDNSWGRQARELYYRNKALGTLVVAPLIFSQAFVPSAKRLLSRRLRYPIADAHYAMGFIFLASARGDSRLHARAVHFLDELEKERSSGFQYLCWGYPFDWESRTGTIPKGTPLITTTPYVYEAFRDVYGFDGNPRWREAMASIARHAAEDIKDFPFSSTASTCGYTPSDKAGGVVNASAYRASMLASASVDLDEERYWKIAERNLNFVLESQKPDGSWFYSVDGGNPFVDHFHTCFVLKALAKIERLKPNERCWQAIAKGVEFYMANLLDEIGRPKPFAKASRVTVYRRELYDYAECINLCLLVRRRIPKMEKVLERVLDDLMARWIKADGSFRSRELWLGWDTVPMHRWGLSQIFRSLSLLSLDEHGYRTADQVM